MVKIMYRYYGNTEYKEIDIKQLKQELQKDRKKEFGIFIIELEDVEYNTLYFGEVDAYDY